MEIVDEVTLTPSESDCADELLLPEVTFDDQDLIGIISPPPAKTKKTKKLPEKDTLAISPTFFQFRDNDSNKPGPDNRYSCKERVRMVQLYAENLNNPRRVQHIFQAEFKKKPPATRTITKLYRKFQETGSVQNNYSKVRPRKSRTKENVEKVKLAFQKTPTKSIRKIAEELNIPHTTVGRILQELKGKEGGQIRRSRTLKLGLRTAADKVQHHTSHKQQQPHSSSIVTVPAADRGSLLSNSTSTQSIAPLSIVTVVVKPPNDFEMKPSTSITPIVTSPSAERQVSTATSTTRAETVEVSMINSEQDPQQQEQPMTSTIVTLQTQPMVTTPFRSTPSILIVETSPQNVLSSLFFCLDFACKKHSTQRRKDPEQTPYINHPIGVANILVNEAHICDTDILQAALLHDTLEDTETTSEELRTEFGSKVASIVGELTDDKSLSKDMRKLLQIENASKKSYGAKLVGMADKIYNLRDLTRVNPVGWSEKRRLEYVVWAQEVVKHYYGANETLARILKDIFLHWNVLSS